MAAMQKQFEGMQMEAKMEQAFNQANLSQPPQFAHLMAKQQANIHQQMNSLWDSSAQNQSVEQQIPQISQQSPVPQFMGGGFHQPPWMNPQTMQPPMASVAPKLEEVKVEAQEAKSEIR